MNFTIRAARPEEAGELTRIALKSKGHWGYSEGQLRHWLDGFLAVSADYVRANRVWVADIDSSPVGFAAVKEMDSGAELDHLWILPECMGNGVGKALFARAAGHVAGTGRRELVFTSDPHADGFYEKMGAQRIGVHHSDFQQRKLTIFRFIVKPGV
ncbi:MAG: GNAT family N-acetyltransferase [Opitutaceae bacterium]|jgi:GNAT superfamily N-acetyltransferase